MHGIQLPENTFPGHLRAHKMCPVTFRSLVLRVLLLFSKQPKAVALISSFIEKRKSKYFLDTLSCPCEYG